MSLINILPEIITYHLDQFLDEAARFERTGGSLNMFLEWLQIAEDEESGIKVSSVDVTSEAVQILTIHSAKGLEWNFVAVPGLVAKDFPASGKTSTAWTKNIGELPIQMRGDRGALIDFEFPPGNPNANGGNLLIGTTSTNTEIRFIGGGYNSGNPGRVVIVY